jgi:hypothetical protein
MRGGPFSGLFKGSPREQPQHLDVNASAFAAWDDNALGQLPSAGGLGGLAGGTGIVPQTVKPGIANGYQAALSYGLSRSGDRASLSLSGDGSFQYFESSSSSKPLMFQSYGLGANLQTKLTNKVSLSFSGTGAYAPYYQYLPFLKSTQTTDSPVGSDYGYAFDSQWVRSAGAGASIDDKFTKKSSISASANWTQQVLTADNRTIETEGVGMRYNHSFTRKLSFYVGYQLSQSQYPESGGAPFRYGNVDLGLGYGDGLVLNFGRYTTLSMNFGVSLAKNGDPVSVAKTGKSTQFFVTGAATLSRTLSRTWSASVGYSRGVTYALGFLEPFYTDSATAGLGGQVVERLFFSLGAGASRGQQIFSEGGSLTAYTGSARLTYGLFSNLGLYAQASYYKYAVPASIQQSFAFVPQLERRSVSAGVTTWFPLIKPPRVRRTPGDQQAGQQ